MEHTALILLKFPEIEISCFCKNSILIFGFAPILSVLCNFLQIHYVVKAC